MKILFLLILMLSARSKAKCWGFYAHQKINRYAVFMLPPEMMVLYKPHIEFLFEHAVDPDKRRYAIKQEAPRHYIDMDHYHDTLPKKWKDAVAKYSVDTLEKYGIVPWWLQTMLYRLTDAFRKKDQSLIMRYSAEIGHYIADSHVPLHATKNHNGQYTDQKGIHGFWESRIPELLDSEWDFLIGKADYIRNPVDFIWARVFESAAAVDTVLKMEKSLSMKFSPDQKFSYEERNGVTIRQYSSAFSRAYDLLLSGMVERRMRQSIYAVASFWYTAWVNAGQPDLATLGNRGFSQADLDDFERLNSSWKKGQIEGQEHE
jgi:hypothetical protein